MRVDIDSIILECAETVSWNLHDPSLQDQLVVNLGFDSLDMVDFVMEVEDAFNIEIDDDTAMSWVTLQDVSDYVKSVLT